MIQILQIERSGGAPTPPTTPPRGLVSMDSQFISPDAVERFWAFVDKGRSDLCWIWTGGRTGHGYGSFFLDGRTQRAHRVCWEMLHGSIPDGLLVLHRCDNPLCVRPDHLFLGTHADNTRDMVHKSRGGTPPRLIGERHPGARLDADIVRQIRSRYASGAITQSQLATDYGVSQGTIGFIVRGETWQDV